MTYSYPQDMSAEGVPEVAQEPRERTRAETAWDEYRAAGGELSRDEPTQDWYFTFAANHLHPFTGESLGRSYVVINATERDAIRAVRDVFGDQWAHYYVSPRQAGVEEYDLQHLPLPIETPQCLAWSSHGGICGQTVPCDGSRHAPVEERTEEEVPEIRELAQALRNFGDRIAQAIGDPGSIVGRRLGPSWGVGEDGYSEHVETVTRWSTRAVLHVLTETGVEPPSAEGSSGGAAALRADVVTGAQALREAAYELMSTNPSPSTSWHQTGSAARAEVGQWLLARADRVESKVRGGQQ